MSKWRSGGETGGVEKARKSAVAKKMSMCRKKYERRKKVIMWRIEEKANQYVDSWRHQLFGINESGINGG
jgi:hypothetical protein